MLSESVGSVKPMLLVSQRMSVPIGLRSEFDVISFLVRQIHVKSAGFSPTSRSTPEQSTQNARRGAGFHSLLLSVGKIRRQSGASQTAPEFLSHKRRNRLPR